MEHKKETLNNVHAQGSIIYGKFMFFTVSFRSTVAKVENYHEN